MKSPVSKKPSPNSSLQPHSEKNPSDFWKAVRTNIKLQHQAPPIKPTPRSGNLPLSFAQERLWFLDQLQPGSSIHNMRAAFRLKGSLNVAVLEKSLKEIVRRHEILRITFPSVDGQPVQIISPNVTLKLPVVDLQELSEIDREEEAQRLAIEEAEQPFDLSEGPLMRVKLLRLAEEEYWLLRTVHHIVFDGWSYRVFMRELAVLYEAFTTGNPSPLPELPVQYADFAQSQRQWLQSEVLSSLLDYWKQQLNGSILALELPVDHPRPTVPNYQGASQSLVLSKNLTTALKKLSAEKGVSLFVALLAAFKTLLHRYTGQEDIIVCSPIAGRTQIEIKRLIGYFNNLVVIRTDLSGNPNFRELIGRVSQVLLEAYKHQDLPFQKLAEFPNLVRTPLNRGMFVLQNTLSQPQELADITLSHLNLNWDITNFDLSLSMQEKGEELSGLFCYRTDLFNDTTITQMQKYFQTLLETLVANPDQRLEDLPCLTPNGKVYRRAVPTPDQTRQDQENTVVASHDELELQLTKIWENVFNIQSINVHDNFFELGGHSLLAVRLFSEINQILGQDLSVVTLFQAPTIQELANILRKQGWSPSWSSLVPVKPKGSKPPFFFHGGAADAMTWTGLSRLSMDQPFYGLQLPALDGKHKFQDSVEEIAAHCLKEIRTLQPHGPYFIGGHCFGGTIAFEMAQQLSAQGEEVALLLLVDAYAPKSEPRESLLWRTQALVHQLDFLVYKIYYYHADELRKRRLIGKLTYIRDWLREKVKVKLQHKINNKWSKPQTIPDRNDSHKSPTSGEFVPHRIRYLQAHEANGAAKAKYIPQVYPGRITLLRASKQTLEWYFGFKLGWEDLATGELESYEIPGLFGNLFNQTSLPLLVEKVKVVLEQAQACSKD